MEYSGIEEDRRLVSITPSNRQLEYQKMEFFCFIHFTVNTFTGNEWGTGKESPKIFNPSNLDVNQWVKTAINGGMKGLILTCKHHDGFCLWPSKYTEHSIKNSPYKNGKGDIVKEVSDSCKKFGLKFGIYLSPWDRNNEKYGKGKEYDDYYINQLTELLTNYGDIFVVWLDGACGEGKSGKSQIYNWERYYETIRKIQPKAVISISGPDIRWCGNEAGHVRSSEWSVVSKDLTNPLITAQLSQKEDNSEFRNRPIDQTQEDLGSRKCLKSEARLSYYPAETDVSIRPGWFYHKEEDSKVRSLENLIDIYLSSVGGNTTLLLNIPPMPNGKLNPTDVNNVNKLGHFLKKTFRNNLINVAEIKTFPEYDESGKNGDVLRKDDYTEVFKNEDGNKKLIIKLHWENRTLFTYLVIKEAITYSQRIEKFSVWYNLKNGEKKKIYDGTTIGYKKIIHMNNIETDSIEIFIEDSRVAPVLSFIGVY